ncbi:MAG: hypothetical protein IPH32_16595 [Bacteroidetes bacterium]|nr:hypothetical protein [Bacteroidota bacterium]
MLRIIKYIYFSVICLILTSKNSYSQSTLQIDTLQYPKGYPNSLLSVSQQLHSYPLPRYFSSHNLQRLFNWMDPNYMGGQGQPNIKTNTAIINAAKIQEELITTWYYGIVITNSGTAFTGPLNKGCPMNIDLANKYPNVSLDVTTLWTQVRPKKLDTSTKMLLF